MISQKVLDDYYELRKRREALQAELDEIDQAIFKLLGVSSELTPRDLEILAASKDLLQPFGTNQLAHKLNVTAGAISAHMPRLVAHGKIKKLTTGKYQVL